MSFRRYLFTQELHYAVTARPRHNVHALFDKLRDVEPYPEGVIAVPEQIQGTSFFPGGTGLWVDGRTKEFPPFPTGGVMVLGHDFHNVDGYRWSKEHEQENLKSPTWRHLLELLEMVDIRREQCFFTNVYMGLREGEKTTGTFPGAKSPEFVGRCRQFFLHQIELQQPSLVLALGAHVPRFLAPLSPELAVWEQHRDFLARDAADVSLLDGVRFGGSSRQPCVIVSLVHPSFRPRNVGARRWRDHKGEPAEKEMILEAKRLAASLPHPHLHPHRPVV